MEHLEAFTALGTRTLRPFDALRHQLDNVKALVFDWDGVFNDGWKDLEGGSPFSEVDSMGVNLLRFALWQRSRTMLPCAVITGQHNPHAQRFAEREHLDGIYMGFSNKPEAFEAFLAKQQLDAKQVAFFFDDVLDLPVARECGLRILLKRNCGPLLESHIIARKDADVITALSGGQHGLREACELLIALAGTPEDVIEHRIRFSADYQEYLAQRGSIVTEVVRKAR